MKKNKSKKEFKRIPLRAEGRPTKYKKIYAQWLVDYFDVDPVEIKVLKGERGDKVHVDAVRLPTLERFATLLNVNIDTISDWANATDEEGNLKHPEFFRAYKQVKQMQKEILISNALKGLYQSNFAIFVATNFMDMKDKKEVDNNLSADGKVIAINYIVPKDDETDTSTYTEPGHNDNIEANEETAPSQISS